MSETCPDIRSIVFSQESRSALREVQRQIKLSKVIAIGVTVGALITALLEDKAIPQMVNIKNTDWNLLFEAVAGMPDASRRQIEVLSLTMSMRTHGDENKFWKAVFYGCKL